MILDIIKKRRSIRKYKKTILDSDIVREIATCGTMYPSRGNKQPLIFYCVENKAICTDIFNHILWGSKEVSYKLFADARFQPSAYVLVAVNKAISKAGYEYEVGAAVQNMLLCATEHEYASLWVKSFEKKEIKKILKINHEIEPDSLVMLGIRDQDSEIINYTDNTSVTIEKNDSLDMKVPKRATDDILFFI